MSTMDQKLILLTLSSSVNVSWVSLLSPWVPMVTCWDSDFKFHRFKDIRVKPPPAGLAWLVLPAHCCRRLTVNDNDTKLQTLTFQQVKERDEKLEYIKFFNSIPQYQIGDSWWCKWEDWFEGLKHLIWTSLFKVWGLKITAAINALQLLFVCLSVSVSNYKVVKNKVVVKCKQSGVKIYMFDRLADAKSFYWLYWRHSELWLEVAWTKLN